MSTDRRPIGSMVLDPQNRQVRIVESGSDYVEVQLGGSYGYGVRVRLPMSAVRDVNLEGMPLCDVEGLYLSGDISEPQWVEYLHLWQTSAVRFTQQCRCSECNRAFGQDCP